MELLNLSNILNGRHIVPILKSDGSVGICGDYRLTVNQASKVAQYPLPRRGDIHVKLAGGQSFEELDLSHAYEQIKLDDQSQEICTINTHKGLF